ncbi:MAG: exodeoxyribonuclease III [Candidatus Paceibacterota bacterium]|jgi:exodeoxyribonuclease-3
MKIISWNTNGLRATHKQGYFLPLLEKYKPDILCLQETKAEPDQLPDEARNPKGYHSYFSFSKKRKGYSGVAIYTKVEPEKVEYGIGIPEFDDEGRIVIAHFKDFVLLNVYFPNGGGGEERLDYKFHFYDAFLTYIDALKKNGNKIIFCGDVNTAHEAIDLARPKENEMNTGFLPEERAWIDEVIDHGYTDIFRHFYPGKIDAYTYWDMKTFARSRNVGWRIDYFFASTNFLPRVIGTKILSDYMGSDHCPIEIEIND